MNIYVGVHMYTIICIYSNIIYYNYIYCEIKYNENNIAFSKEILKTIHKLQLKKNQCRLQLQIYHYVLSRR